MPSVRRVVSRPEAVPQQRLQHQRTLVQFPALLLYYTTSVESSVSSSLDRMREMTTAVLLWGKRVISISQPAPIYRESPSVPDSSPSRNLAKDRSVSLRPREGMLQS